METGRFRWGLSMLASIGVGAICTFAFLLLGALRVATKFFEFLLWCSTHNNCDGSISPSRGLSPHPFVPRWWLLASLLPLLATCVTRVRRIAPLLLIAGLSTLIACGGGSSTGQGGGSPPPPPSPSAVNVSVIALAENTQADNDNQKMLGPIVITLK